jgi:multiple sugar transport system substrate-binding protein
VPKTPGRSLRRQRRAAGTGRLRRGLAGAAALLVTAGTLAACGGGGDGGVPTLTWYTNPDTGGQAEIASRCSEASDGAYTISNAPLPRQSAAQREQLARRLAANDSSIDLISLDPPFIPEFAEAGFLAPIPEDVAQRVTEGVVDSAVTGSTWNDELVAVPFWANTQLLWYRKSVAEAAGLDTNAADTWTWDDVIAAAQDQDVLIGAQGIRAESLMVWFNALIESGGGSVIEEQGKNPRDVTLGLTSEAGQRAGEVMRAVADSGQVSAAFSTETEDISADGFQSDQGGFMVNWPYVYQRANVAVEAGTLDASVPEDYAWTFYPRVDEDTPSAPPLGGISIGVGAFSQHPDLAMEAAECIVSFDNQKYYMLTNGNPAALAAVYDDPEVIEDYPMAPTIRESLERAVPRPQTPFYSEVSEGLQRTYHPASSVDESTGQEATELITAVLAGEKLL